MHNHSLSPEASKRLHDHVFIVIVCETGRLTFPEDEWSEISDEAKDLIKRLMSKWPRRRPSAADALQHEWLAKFN